MRSTRVSFFLLTLLLAVSVSAFATEPALQPVDAKLNILGGQVKLTRVGKTLSDVYNSGFPLFAGDLIETLRESKAELVYGDGTVMRIKPLTLIEVQPTALKMFKGKTWFKFTKRGTEFVIETPSLVAGIRGTVFDVAVSSRGKSVLSVMEGAVAVKGSKDAGKRVFVKAGYATHSETGKGPVLPYQINVEKKNNEWKTVEWIPSNENDAGQLYLNYSNLNAEFGPEDPRTIEAKRVLEEAQAKTKSRK